MKQLELFIERIILASRWLLVVFYIGLGIALALYAVSFGVKLWKFATHIFTIDEAESILDMLGLIDAALVASLVVMVIISGYENFVGKFDNEEDVHWLGEIDINSLKIKVASTIVAISSIHLLQVFLNVERYASDKLMWYTLIHIAFVVSALFLAFIDRVSAMTKALAARPGSDGDPERTALARFGAFGRGYLKFAQDEPGLFHTVFAPAANDEPPPFERTETSPFQLLVSALDDLVDVGYLSPERRPSTEFTAWAMVHGLATLLDGPLADLSESMRDEVIVRSMLVLGHGLKGTGLDEKQETMLASELKEVAD